MARRKVCVVVTARPSYSRIKTALQAIKEHPDLELQLVVAASALLDRYGTVVRYIEHDGFEIAARVYMVLEGENPASMAKTTGIGLLELATVFDNLKPDVVITVADRYETLATAELDIPSAQHPTSRYALLRCTPLTGRFRQILRVMETCHGSCAGTASRWPRDAGPVHIRRGTFCLVDPGPHDIGAGRKGARGGPRRPAGASSR